MAAPIDDKVVAMSFESAKFEQGVNSTLQALDKLKASLQFPNAGKGLEEFGKSASRLDLGHISRAVDTITDRLGFLRLTGIAVFADLAASAIRSGTQFAKSFTIEPIKAGFAEYSTNLNAIQTILANTQASGATLDDVNAALLNLNKYSDQTIYNFSQMAKNIGTFTAAGVDLDTATSSIKGIANLAALSGSNSEQASTAMYQLSQAIAAGKVSLQDWNSVVNAGMGGTVFQRALAQTAVAMGKLNENSLKLVGPMKNVSIQGRSFRESIQAAPGKTSWLTSDVLTKTLQTFTGDLTDAELKAQGFNDAQIKSIQQTAKTAKHAATEVKTISQVFDVAKETAGSGWAQTFQLIFGDFGEAKKTFTALSNTINGFINTNAQARNKVLKDWKELGGRTVLLDSIKTTFHNLGEIIKPIKDAFREFFPATTGKDLFALTKRFQEFAEALKPSPETIDNIRRTFRGLFAVLDIGKQIVGGIFSVFGQLFHALGGGDGGFLKFTASIGDNLVALDKWLKEGNKVQAFFNSLGNIISKPLDLLGRIAGAFANLFSGFSPGGISDGLDSVTASMTPLERVVHSMADAWDRFMKSIDDAIDAQGIIEGIGKAIAGIGTAIGNAASNMNFDAILAVIQTGLFGGLVLMFKKFLGRGTFLDQISKGFGRGIISNISGTFGALEGSMKAMQTNIKAKTLKEIAIAIALLTASVVALSFVSPEDLKTSLKAMTVMFAQLIATLTILDKWATTGGALRLPFIAGGLILLAAAIGLLTVSVYALSRLSWDELKKGLTGVTVLLTGITAASIPLSANSAGLIRAGVGITAIAIALRILADAVEAFSQMNWQEMSRGLVGVGVGLGIIVLSMNKMTATKGLVSAGAGLILIATGLRILAEAVEKFGSMNLQTLGKGLGSVAVSMGIMIAAMKLMPAGASMVRTGAGLILMAAALNLIALAVEKMGGMSIEQIAHAMITLGGALGILAAAMKLMPATLKGSAALLIMAGAIAVLAPALVLLGKQSWTNIVKGLVSLGGALAVLGVAGLALAPVAPALLALGVAVALIGGGLALAGAGLFLIAAGLSALAVAGPAGVGVLIAALNELLEAIPTFAKNLVLGVLEIAKAFAATAPQFVKSIVKIIDSILDAIIQSAPKVADAVIVLIGEFLRILDAKGDDIIKAGFELLISFLKGLRQNIGEIVRVGADIIVQFLKGLATKIGDIVKAGANLIVQFLKGVAQNIGKVVTAAFDVIVNFVRSIGANLGRLVTAGIGVLTNLIVGIYRGFTQLVKAGTDAVVKFIEGVGAAGPRIVTAATNAIIKFINALSSNSVKLADAGAKAIISFLNGMADVINRRAPEMRAAGARVGVAIIDGLTFGLASKVEGLYGKLREIANKVKGILGKLNPFGGGSKDGEKAAGDTVDGLNKGLKSGQKSVQTTAAQTAQTIPDAFSSTLQTKSPSRVMIQIGEYVGQGFAIGLRKSQDDVRTSFSDMNALLLKSISDARQTIATEQGKLDELWKAKKLDTAAIKEAQNIIAQNQDIIARSQAAHAALIHNLQDEKKELIGLQGEFQRISDKLEAAKQALDQAKQARDDAAKGFRDQYSTTPDIADKNTAQITAARDRILDEQNKLNDLMASSSSTAEQITQQQNALIAAKAELDTLISGKTLDASGNSIDQLATYMQALTNQTKAVQTYSATLDQLRKLGLDDATYQKLLTEGTADQAFASQLLAGGKTAVQGLNKLDAQLQRVSGALATKAAKNLYQAGVDAAQGLVNGLQSKKDALRQAIEDIAEEILITLKKKLKIKSPSQEMMEIGLFAMKGMAEGFTQGRKLVADSVSDAASNAITAMRKSMRNLSQVVADELNPNPVITPILDLTTVQGQAKQLAGLTNVVPITAAASYGQASAISTQQRVIAEEAVASETGPNVTEIKFEQNNTSPVALSEVEIYRLTKNQLSQAKSVLGIRSR